MSATRGNAQLNYTRELSLPLSGTHIKISRVSALAITLHMQVPHKLTAAIVQAVFVQLATMSGAPPSMPSQVTSRSIV